MLQTTRNGVYANIDDTEQITSEEAERDKVGQSLCLFFVLRQNLDFFAQIYSPTEVSFRHLQLGKN